ncbi:MAG: hypothetical protein NUW01_20180 [Gemmatimonadaceae bacterium]|nr:hypothetical protein [Gemmatimonadaceae bacterium]
MKLYWGSSVGRSYDPDHVTSIVKLFANSPYPLYWRPIHGDALIERSRARAATAFLASDAEVFLSVDTDIIFDWHDAVQIAEQAVEHSIVVGAYTTRSPLRSFVTSALNPHEPVEFFTDPTPVPIRWGATGFMAVHRRVFEALVKRADMPLCHANEDLRHYPFFLPFVVEEAGTHVMLSEDYAFCERARQEGFTTYLNPAVRLGHLGGYCYRLEDMVTQGRPAPMPIRLTRMNEGAPVNYRVETPTAEEQRLVAASA